jgi:hypothetical protein
MVDNRIFYNRLIFELQGRWGHNSCPKIIFLPQQIHHDAHLFPKIISRLIIFLCILEEVRKARIISTRHNKEVKRSSCGKVWMLIGWWFNIIKMCLLIVWSLRLRKYFVAIWLILKRLQSFLTPFGHWDELVNHLHCFLNLGIFMNPFWVILHGSLGRKWHRANHVKCITKVWGNAN